MHSAWLLLYLIPVFLLGYWLLRRERQPPPLPDATARALALLRRRGADPTQPATVTYSLSFETRQAAEAAERDVPPTWATAITELPDQHRWVFTAATRMVPGPDDLSTQAQELEATAMRHGGEYDGLEVAP